MAFKGHNNFVREMISDVTCGKSRKRNIFEADDFNHLFIKKYGVNGGFWYIFKRIDFVVKE